MKNKKSFVPSLADQLQMDNEIFMSPEFGAAWDARVDAYNAICPFLEKTGLNGEQITAFLKLLHDYEVKDNEVTNLLYAINTSGGLKRYRLYKSIDDGTFKGSSLDFVMGL